MSNEYLPLQQNKSLKLSEYYLFAGWIALPRIYRQPQTQGEFSELYKVGHDTLARWKKDPQFWEDVRRVRDDWARNLVSDVIGAVYNAAMNGDFKAQEYFLNNFGDLSTKTEETKKLEVGDNLAAVLLQRARERRLREHEHSTE